VKHKLQGWHKYAKGLSAPFFFAVLIFGLYLFIASRSTLWDRDEPRYASVTAEMVRTGHYLVPSFEGRAWPDKPILLYWLMSIPMRLLGPSEIACRFWSAVGAAVSCLLTYAIGKKLFSSSSALWAVAFLSSAFLFIFVGSAALADGIVLPFIIAAMFVFISASDSRFTISHILLMGLLFGFGMLAKGPVGLLPVLVITVVIWLNRKEEQDSLKTFLKISLAALLGCLIFLLWAIPANFAAGGNFLQTFIIRHILTRAVKPLEHHGGNWLLFLPYYIPIIIVGFYPFILHLPGAVSAILGERVGGRKPKIILLSWFVSIVILMSLAATKLPHYILFIWPALALMVAGTLEAWDKGLLVERDRKWLRGGVWFFGPVTGAFAAAGIAGPFFLCTRTGLNVPMLNWSGPLCGLILIITAAAAIYFQLKEQFLKSSKILLAGTAVFLLPFLFGVLPGIEQIKIPPAIAEIVREKTGDDVPVAEYKFDEPSLNFYIARPIEHLAGGQAVADWALQKTKGVLIIPKEKLDEISGKFGQLPLEQAGSKKGVNYSKGKTVEILVFVKKEPVAQ
jgi:4-amino-4-deoxy-L-arabinose transferase-like glycosyltransferase